MLEVRSRQKTAYLKKNILWRRAWNGCRRSKKKRDMGRRLTLWLRHLPFAESIWLLLLLLGVMLGVIFPEALEGIRHWSGGRGIPDQWWYYRPGELAAYLEQLGQEGRMAYGFMLLTADLVFPLFYTVFFLLLAHRLLAGLPRSWRYRLILLPLLPGFFDLLENSAMSLLLRAYPNPLSPLARLASACTLLKWISLGGLLVLLLCLLARHL
jgi:hypothetical protein